MPAAVAASCSANMLAAWEPPASAIYATYAGNRPMSVKVCAFGRVADGTSTSALGRVSRTHRQSTTLRNCTRDEGGPFEAGSQVQVSSHRELLSSRAMVVSVAETSGHDHGRQG